MTEILKIPFSLKTIEKAKKNAKIKKLLQDCCNSLLHSLLKEL